MAVSLKKHWESVYEKKRPTKVSWYQDRPVKSLNFILKNKVSKNAQIIDIGGGASTLVDHLLAKRFNNVTVLDISEKAIRAAKKRLGKNAKNATWIQSDITKAKLPHEYYDVWHDRALFHFLIKKSDRKKYVKVLKNVIRSNGHVIISTFSLSGPPKCSGLPIRRYDAKTIGNELGACFILLKTLKEAHKTPLGAIQNFTWCFFTKKRAETL